MRKLLFFVLVLVAFSSSAQTLPQSSLAKLRKMEDSMKVYAREMIMDRTASQRFSADSVFIRMLVRSLKTPNSFYYPYDSLITVSHIYAPDSSFRIFSWQFTRDEDYYRQRGAIQMRTADGSLRLYPLIDMSDFTTAPQDSVRTSQSWIGAIYYAIVMKTFNNKNYYTLLGFDDNHMRSTKKWIDVLTFDDKGKPVFGGPYFTFTNAEDKAKSTPSQARFFLEFKKDGRARMNYDRELDMIVYDHLVSETNEPDKVYTYVPDGDYQGFKWENGRWVQVDKVFDFKLKDGEAPVPEPLKDENGKSNEEKLLQQSSKNREINEGIKNTPPPAAPVKKSLKKGGVRPKDENEY
jgi:outer membrane lipoprotein-sorting protein